MSVSDEYGVNTGPKPIGDIPTRGEMRFRVRYAECDPMNVAHHASYAPWLEMGRTELLRQGKVSYAELEQAGVFLVVTKLELRYRRPTELACVGRDGRPTPLPGWLVPSG